MNQRKEHWHIAKDGSLEQGKISSRNGQQNPQDEEFNAVAFASQFGISVALPVVGGAFLGQYLDNLFHTTPKMTLSGIMIGMLLSITNAYFLIKKLISKK